MTLNPTAQINPLPLENIERVALYARVSGARQTQTQTIEQQLTSLQAELKRREIIVSDDHVYRDDGFSGAMLNRPGLDRLRDLINMHEIDLVLITAPDRLARKYVHQVLMLEEFEKRGCRVEFVEHPMSNDPHDQLLLQIRGAVAEYERTLISERMRRGRLAKLRAGVLLPWTSVPYGFRSDPARPRDPTGVRIEQTEAVVIQSMFDAYLKENATLYSVTLGLATSGIPSPKKNSNWCISGVRHFLMNPAYTGICYGNRYRTVKATRRLSPLKPVGDGHSCRLRPKEEWIPIPVPAIVTQDVFDLVQAKLARGQGTARRNNKTGQYLLRCLLSCGRCQACCMGRRMGRDQKYGYYMCNQKTNQVKAIANGRCTARYIPSRQLDDAVWADVCEVMTNPEVIRLALERAHGGQWQPQELQARAQNIRVALEQLANQNSRLLEAYLAGVVELSEFERTKADLGRKADQLRLQQRQLELSATHRQELVDLTVSIEGFCDSVRAGLVGADFEQKRRLVELLIDRVIVEDGMVEIRYVVPTSRDGPRILFCQLRLNHLDPTITVMQ
jgi:site-specific DNA recombinase